MTAIYYIFSAFVFKNNSSDGVESSLFADDLSIFQKNVYSFAKPTEAIQVQTYFYSQKSYMLCFDAKILRFLRAILKMVIFGPRVQW